MERGDRVRIMWSKGPSENEYVFEFLIPHTELFGDPDQPGASIFLRHLPGVEGGCGDQEMIDFYYGGNPVLRQKLDELRLWGSNNWVVTIPPEWVVPA